MEEQNQLDYKKLVETALLAGTILIASGAETYRVEDTAHRILKTSGFQTTEAFVLPTGITLTLSNESDCTYSLTKRISPGASNMNKIITVNSISRSFCSGEISLDDAYEKLKELSDKHIYSKIFKVIGCSLAGGGFSLMFGGNIYDFIVALVCSFVIGMALYYLSKVMRKDIFINIFATAVLCLMASGISLFASRHMPGITLSPQFIIEGSIMSLVPGLSLTNAIRDLLHGDFVSACARFVEAITTSISIAVGAAAGLYLTQLIGISSNEIGFILESGREPIIELIVGFLGAYIAMLGFSIIYEIPSKFFFFSPVMGVVAWIVYTISTLSGISNVWASMLGAMSAAFCSFILARVLKAPVTLFLVSGIIPLVPGFYIYRASYYLITGSELAGEALVNTLMIAGAISLGIILMDTFLETIVRIIKKQKEKSIKTQ